MPYLCDLFFIFILNFIVSNNIISLPQTHLFYLSTFLYLSYFWMVRWTRKANNFQIAKNKLEGVAYLLHDFLPI